MEDSSTYPAAENTEAPEPGAGTPEDTSSLPVVEGSHSSRLHRAANFLSRGQTEQAAALCREEITEEPSSTEAYALLAMAEEQAGNLHLATEVYEELLRLDPDRRAEAEHLEELRQTLEELEAEEPSPEEREVQLRQLRPVAWIVLIGAAFFFLASLSLFLVARQRVANTQAQYQTALRTGATYYQSAQYTTALAWFGEALRLRPGDQASYEWYAAAYRQSRLLASRSQSTQSRLASRVSPFQPVPIGQTPAGQSNPMPTPTTALPAPPAIRGDPREPVPPAPTPDDSTGGFLSPPTEEDRGPIFPPQRAEVPPSPTPASAQPPAPAKPPKPEPQPVIKITVSDRPPPRATSGQERADHLRAEGKRLYQEDNYREAISTYQQAIAAYQEELSAHPEKRPALDSSIATIQAEIRLCEKNLQ